VSCTRLPKSRRSSRAARPTQLYSVTPPRATAHLVLTSCTALHPRHLYMHQPSPSYPPRAIRRRRTAATGSSSPRRTRAAAAPARPAATGVPPRLAALARNDTFRDIVAFSSDSALKRFLFAMWLMLPPSCILFPERFPRSAARVRCIGRCCTSRLRDRGLVGEVGAAAPRLSPVHTVYTRPGSSFEPGVAGRACILSGRRAVQTQDDGEGGTSEAWPLRALESAIRALSRSQPCCGTPHNPASASSFTCCVRPASGSGLRRLAGRLWPRRLEIVHA